MRKYVPSTEELVELTAALYPQQLRTNFTASQRLILKYMLEDFGYEEIAESTFLNLKDIKRLAKNIFDDLSQILGLFVNKSNLKSILVENYPSKKMLVYRGIKYQQKEPIVSGMKKAVTAKYRGRKYTKKIPKNVHLKSTRSGIKYRGNLVNNSEESSAKQRAKVKNQRGRLGSAI